MRDPKRINRILKLIKKIWNENPNLRFCQLIDNVLRLEEDIFYIEDEDFEKRFKIFYKMKGE